MCDRNHFLNFVVNIITGNGNPQFLPKNQKPIFDQAYLNILSETLQNRYPRDVQRNVWLGLDLHQEIDRILGESSPFRPNTESGTYVCQDGDHQEIADRCAATVCKKLQHRIGSQFQVRYIIMRNGQVGLRLE